MAKKATLNMQQMPKSEAFQSCFVARPGHVIVQLDFNSIEDVVLTEASEDPAMFKIYGPNVACNDGYLFIGANIPSLATNIRKYYDPDNPTEAGIEAAKIHCKSERKASKIVKLASTYGAYPRMIQGRLAAAGFPVSFEQAEAIWTAYWELFAGISEFKESLYVEWRNNGGWFYNGTGRPVGLDERKTKDFVNQYCQSTAHDLLVIYMWHINRLRKERKVPMWAWIPDWHDESMFECPTGAKEEAKQVLIDALVCLNEEAGGVIEIKGGPCEGFTLWDIKKQ